MNLKVKKVYECDINELRFNHYNLNSKQLKWMENFFKRKEFTLKKDNSMKKFKQILFKNKKPENTRVFNKNYNISEYCIK